jgi:hypothetical protein
MYPLEAPVGLHFLALQLFIARKRFSRIHDRSSAYDGRFSLQPKFGFLPEAGCGGTKRLE